MAANLSPFMNPAAVATYTHDTPRKVPGLADLHRMTAILLAERAPAAAHILVVGAGGGLELKAMAEAVPGWCFTGVDPSSAMLDIARETVASYTDRTTLLLGTVDQVPRGPFDGAVCLLTLHFLDRSERLHTLREIRGRMKPGRALVIAHHTSPDGNPEAWLARSATFADQTVSNTQKSANSAKAMAERLPLLTPAEEEALLLEAGFIEPKLFYAAFSFRGWVAIAS
jgi:tRNA (cmo5U34)-methyltransferase